MIVKKALAGWIILIALALAFLPWHQQEAGFFAARWLSADWSERKDAASALFLLIRHGSGVFWPLLGLLVASLLTLLAPLARNTRGLLFTIWGGLGILYLLILGFRPVWLGLGPQVGLGYGALIERLLELAVERHAVERSKTSRARELET